MPKGSFKSKYFEGVLLLQKNIPNLYPKLLHPVHGIAGSQCVTDMKTQLYENENAPS